MKTILLSFSLLISGIVNAGDWQRRELSYFDEIKVSGNVRVQLVLSEENYLEIYDFCCSRSDLRISQDGRTLKINYDKGIITDEDFDVVVYYTNLKKIQAQIGAGIESKDMINSQRIELLASTGGKLNLEIQAVDIELEATTGSMVYLNGKSERLDIVANTGSMVELDDLLASDVFVKAFTGADISLTAEKSLRAKAGTGGTIDYSGNPKIFEMDTHLGGEIHCRQRSEQ